MGRDQTAACLGRVIVGTGLVIGGRNGLVGLRAQILDLLEHAAAER